MEQDGKVRDITTKLVSLTPEPREVPKRETYGKCPRDAAQAISTLFELSKDQKVNLQMALDSIDIDPVLMLKLRTTWVPPANVSDGIANDILNYIANWKSPRARRDKWPGMEKWAYHFKDIAEIIECREHLLEIHPYCFGPSQRAIALGFGQPSDVAKIFADAVVVNKLAVRDDDVIRYPFFEF